MNKKGGSARLKAEVVEIKKHPLTYAKVDLDVHTPVLLHLLLNGPQGSPYEGGQYYMKLLFNISYPYSEPTLRAVTPSGRFKPGRVCVHFRSAEEDKKTTPLTLRAIIQYLQNFMFCSIEEPTAGAIITNNEVKKRFAANSKAFNKTLKEYQEVFQNIGGEDTTGQQKHRDGVAVNAKYKEPLVEEIVIDTQEEAEGYEGKQLGKEPNKEQGQQEFKDFGRDDTSQQDKQGDGAAVNAKYKEPLVEEIVIDTQEEAEGYEGKQLGKEPNKEQGRHHPKWLMILRQRKRRRIGRQNGDL